MTEDDLAVAEPDRYPLEVDGEKLGPEARLARARLQADKIVAQEDARKDWVEWIKKPWWVQQQEAGDYHYGRYDVDWEEPSF